MSPQAIADPEDLEKFARELKQFNHQLTASTAQLKSRFARLGDTWRDQEHQKYAQEFDQAMRVIERFMRESEQHIPVLTRKARIIREYLQR